MEYEDLLSILCFKVLFIVLFHLINAIELVFFKRRLKYTEYLKYFIQHLFYMFIP